jgi:predicted Fe-Mo cluster-binding NifX family protein
MSRIAISATSSGLDAEIEPRFCRSPLLLLVDPDTMVWESVENPGRDTRGGAAPRVAQILTDLDVSDVVSGGFEPSAHDAFQTAGIVVHRCDLGASVRQAVQQLRAGELPEDFWK